MSSDVPEYLRRLEPERYRYEMEESLVQHPGDMFAAAMAAWRTWARERGDWCRMRGVRSWEERQQLLGSAGSAPVGWVTREYGP